MMQFAQNNKAHFQTTTNMQIIHNNNQSIVKESKKRQEVDMAYDMEQRCSAEW